MFVFCTNVTTVYQIHNTSVNMRVFQPIFSVFCGILCYICPKQTASKKDGRQVLIIQ